MPITVSDLQRMFQCGSVDSLSAAAVGREECP